MSESDREKMGDEINGIIESSIKTTSEALKRGIAEAVKAVEGEMIVNAWGDWVRENSSDYEFINSLQAQIWNAMLSKGPSKLPAYKLDRLVEAWRERFPEQWAEIVNADAAKKIESLEKELRFERQVNSHRC